MNSYEVIEIWDFNPNKETLRSTWVAQVVECLTLGFSSGHDPRVVGSNPMLGSMLHMEPTWDSLSLSLSFPLPSLCTLSLYKKKKEEEDGEKKERKRRRRRRRRRRREKETLDVVPLLKTQSKN